LISCSASAFSSSMSFLSPSIARGAPRCHLPLMKKLGVPRTPNCLPIAMSASTLALLTCLSSSALNFGHVEAQLLGVLLDVGARHRLLVLEEDVVHLPELALLAGGERGLGAHARVLVHRQRELLEHHAHVLGVRRVLD
jgi:hypothetical protein